MEYFSAEHRDEERILVEFPYDKVLISKIRTLNDTRWSASKKAWHIPASQESFSALSALFPEIVSANTIAQKDFLVPKPPLPEKVARKIIKVIQYKENRHRIIAKHEPNLIRLLKTFPFTTYDEHNKWWSSSLGPKQEFALEQLARQYDMALETIDGADQKIIKQRPKHYEVLNYRPCPENMIEKLRANRYEQRTVETYVSLFEEFKLLQYQKNRRNNRT